MKHIAIEDVKQGQRIVIFDFYGKYRILEFLCFEPGTNQRYAYFIDNHKNVERHHVESLTTDYNAFVFYGNYESLTHKQITIWQKRIDESKKELQIPGKNKI